MQDSIGFIGLGAMGLPMARNLARAVKAPQALHVYNRTKSKAQPLLDEKELSVKVADSAGDLLQTSTIICIMLADDKACDAVLTELEVRATKLGAGGTAAGKAGVPLLIINHTTSSPEFTSAVEERIASFHLPTRFIAAPVFGRPDAAAAAKLLAVPAGAAEDVKRAMPVLDALGRVMPVGDVAHKANVVKLTGNFMISSMIEMLGEAVALLDKNGVGRQVLVDFVDTFFPAPPLQGYCKRIAANQLEAGQGFTVDLALKDLRYVRNMGEQARVPLPLADTVFQHLLAASAQGHGTKDWGAIALAVQAAAGLPTGKEPAGSG